MTDEELYRSGMMHPDELARYEYVTEMMANAPVEDVCPEGMFWDEWQEAKAADRLRAEDGYVYDNEEIPF